MWCCEVELLYYEQPSIEKADAVLGKLKQYCEYADYSLSKMINALITNKSAWLLIFLENEWISDMIDCAIERTFEIIGSSAESLNALNESNSQLLGLVGVFQRSVAT